MVTNIKTTGVNPPSDTSRLIPVPVRREIRDLQANFPDQWNLFILGLAAFQKLPASDPMSYYQLSGIHGRPFRSWNDVKGLDDFGDFGGYCTHSSVVFLTWHRPFLALYEQALYNAVQAQASLFPEAQRSRWLKAASDFRMPYYDWTQTASGIAYPDVFGAKNISVIQTDGVKRPVPNPLYNFNFRPAAAPANELGQWSTHSTTVRYPTRGDSDNGAVRDAIQNEYEHIRGNVALLLLQYARYNAVSNNRWLRNEKPGEYGSLENIHDNLHDTIGGNGNMSALEVSAFDPIFWLHHTNVDRLWAIWGDLNPNSYVEAGTTRQSSFTMAAGSTQDATTPLKPFWDKTGTRFYTSNDVKSTKTFGYAYPETQAWNHDTVPKYQAALVETVKKLFGDGNTVKDFLARAGAPTQRNFALARQVVTKDVELPDIMEKRTAPVTNDDEPMVGVSVPSAPPSAAGPKRRVLAPSDDVTPVPPVPEFSRAPAPTDDGPMVGVTVPSAPPSAAGPKRRVLAPSDDVTPIPPVPDFRRAAPVPHDDPATPIPPVVDIKQAQKPLAPGDDGEDIIVDANPIPEKFSNLLKEYRQWVANLRVQKHALNTTFRVFVFLGDFDPNPETWPFEKNMVGRFAVLGRGEDTSCAKCRNDQQEELVVTGTVSLTTSLLGEMVGGDLESLEPEVVVPYLQRQLHWRVQTITGDEVPRDSVADLKVSVISAKVVVGDDGIQRTGEWDVHTEVTDGRPAGLTEGDPI
ncbi:Di-copper centre-containing protein [Trichodelitschia bisporula]|uniref:tyrosinase n=1 Tax=Trichodelitschia bisporula TaxID=703511 RepID=A0A6G1HLY0_9PEZI|nr:Di-copper centre-containing protein [Trichodelitschia bisporula]